MKQPLCGRADLLKAIVSDRNESVSFVVRSLGFEKRKKSDESNQKKTSDLSKKSRGKSDIHTIENEKRQAFPDIIFWRVEAQHFFKTQDKRELKPTFSQPPWVLSQEQTPPGLAHWHSIIPRIRRELAATTGSNRIDIPKTLNRLSRAEIMSHFPRKQRRCWGNALQIIVDRSLAMTPYWQDQINICAELERLFPKDSIQYADYRQGDSEPVLAANSGECHYHLPSTGSLVILLGDLGILSSATERTKWRRLGERLKQNNCGALALTPTELDFDKTGLQRFWQIIPWEQSGSQVANLSSLDDQARRLLALISPATRIDRGFLRQVRRLIGADAALESIVWAHPALIGKSSIAATIDPELSDQLRDEFEQEDEALRKQVLRRLRNWRTHLPPEIWYEEIISLTPASQALLDKVEEVEQAQFFFNELGQKVGQGNIPQGLSNWFRNLVQRLPKHTWYNNSLKPALHKVWANTHQGEQDAVPPPDYQPQITQQTATQTLRYFQFYQLSNKLKIVDTHGEIGTNESNNLANSGSWLGQLKSHSGEIVITPQISDQPDFWQSGVAPTWVSNQGEDECGRWAEFEINHESITITKRMRWICPGTFLMGSPGQEAEREHNEDPQHQVTLSKGYWIFDTAVSQALWQVVMKKNPSKFSGAQRPVENVSWHDCQEFIDKLNLIKPGLTLMLPIEAQWEYACRAGSQTPFSFGQQISTEQANYDGNYPYADTVNGEYREKTVDVKSFLPNAWGLYQMHGNVVEWCMDGLRDYSNNIEVNPTGSQVKGARRVVRGGSWGGDARDLRAAFRYEFVPDYRFDYLGFRCVRVQAGAEPVEPLRHRSGTRRSATVRNGAAMRIELLVDTPFYLRNWPKQYDYTIRSDVGELVLRQQKRPHWASAMGRDCFGLWAEIEVEGEQGNVSQRLRWVLPGRFAMGSPENERRELSKNEDELEWFETENPQHLVTISQGYWLFDTPVTQALWQAIMESNPSEFKSPQRPVETVNWDDANKFMTKLNKKIPGLNLSLPTEAQWEYACRANTETATYQGELEILGARNAPSLDKVAWYGGNSGEGFDLEEGYDSSDWPEKQYGHNQAGTREVALKKANTLGLYDMLGNVFEWCTDGLREYEDKEAFDPVGSEEAGARRVVRGGSWKLYARGLRAAYRGVGDPDDRNDGLGFRCARVQEPVKAQASSDQGSGAEPRPDRSEAE